MKRIITSTIVPLLAAAALMGFTSVSGKLESSTIYPGTEHDYIVTVSDNYCPGEPAGLYIGLDGVLMNAPEVIDSLSARGVIPPMVCVFLQPGIVRQGERVVRYNRSNEFDAIDGRFPLFLETELLPAVAGTEMEDGRVVSVPARPEHRMIMGLSSGGIAALNAALRRPDLIGKVFSGCGTFVPMRGGEQLQVLIRKTEPLPLRVFLQDGYRDSWNPLFGSWFEANLLVNSALEFSGVDVAHDWADGVHSVKRATEIFPEVMRWMWRDYPAALPMPVSGNSTLSRLLIEDEGWRPDGNVSHIPSGGKERFYPDSSLVASVVDGSGRIFQSVVDRETGERMFTQPFYWLHSLENDSPEIADMAFDDNGYLWVLTRDGIQVCDQNGRVRAILRVPVGIKPVCISVRDGKVLLITKDGKVFSRRFNVKEPVNGVTPKSEGQA